MAYNFKDVNVRQ